MTTPKLPSNTALAPFEEAPDFDEIWAQILIEVTQDRIVGYAEHGDGGASTGLQGLLFHCWRKSKDIVRFLDNNNESANVEELIRELSTFSMLARAYMKMAKSRGLM